MLQSAVNLPLMTPPQNAHLALTILSDVRCSSLLWISFTLSASSPTSSYLPRSSPLTTLLQWCSWACFTRTTSKLKLTIKQRIIVEYLLICYGIRYSLWFEMIALTLIICLTILSHGCGSRHFDHLLLVFIRQWCRLAVCHYKQHRGCWWLVHFDPRCGC